MKKEKSENMKIKIYIITYKKNEILNANLKSLWESTREPENIDVTILANHPEVQIDEENLRPNLKVVFNTTRMPHAWGYLSRDWNYCLLDCFKTFKNKENVDWCVLAQNDITWVDSWDVWLKNNKDFDFISQPRGDQSMAINIEAIKKIGFFDERFTTLHCQEIDYFTRAAKALKQRCSINDDHENVNWNFNPVGSVITNSNYSGIDCEQQALHNSLNCTDSINYWANKYSIRDFHSKNMLELTKLTSKKEINWYPFFWHDDNEEYTNIKETFLDEYYNTPTKSNFDKLKLFLNKIKQGNN